ncbi:site-specific integrase [Myceligenerans cantabricum]
MTATTETKQDRRPRGEGSLYFDAKRDRWIAVQIVGYNGRGRPIKRKGSGKTESTALREMRKRVREYEAGLVPRAERLTVSQAVEDWLEFGQTGEAARTHRDNRDMYNNYIKDHLGGRKLKELRAEEVDKWLASFTASVGTSMLRHMHSVLNRSVRRAAARGYVERNVVEFCKVPKGRPGRRSKSLTMEQARAVLEHRSAREHWMYPYIVLSLVVGIRTEEARALTWDRVRLAADEQGGPPSVEVWRSVRESGDTKTQLSRRTLALPEIAVEALRGQRQWQTEKRDAAGAKWQDTGLVFTTGVGTWLSADNARRDFRKALRGVPGIDAAEWTPRELRHSFVSLMSSNAVPIEEVSRLVGHSNTMVTELVYRHELRPVVQTGAQAIDGMLDRERRESKKRVAEES